jgi:hypothetical protein
VGARALVRLGGAPEDHAGDGDQDMALLIKDRKIGFERGLGFFFKLDEAETIARHRSVNMDRLEAIGPVGPVRLSAVLQDQAENGLKSGVNQGRLHKVSLDFLQSAPPDRGNRLRAAPAYFGNELKPWAIDNPRAFQVAGEPVKGNGLGALGA